MLLKTGNQAEASRIDTRWQELVALSGQSVPSEYQLTYPKELIDDMAATVHGAANA
ncbi:MAG: hypothetical protein K2X38_16495 [Gemmataceae bacterium]|nr:hypothetical protein [Gemmataceae bacterium]